MIDRLNNDYSEKFDFLSKERIAKFRRKNYVKGDIIYAQKFKFIILLHGKAKLNCYENGKEFIFSFVKSGAYVCLDKNTSLEILSDCETLQINISELFELLGDLERIENRDARAAVELDDLLLLRGDSVKVALDLLEELPIIHVDSCV